jgi:hypothetical protein
MKLHVVYYLLLSLLETLASDIAGLKLKIYRRFGRLDTSAVVAFLPIIKMQR